MCMYKKRLLKIKHGKKVVGVGLLGLMLLGSFGNVFAGNTGDTFYNYNSTSYGFATETRDKTDYTSAYIRHKGVNSANVQVRSEGINYSANGGSYYVAAGTSAYLPNYVKENGKNNCYLYLTPSPAISSTLYGQWSLDSI